MGALNNVKVTMFFSTTSGPGFNESHIYQTVVDLNSEVLFEDIINLASWRSQILDGTNCTLFKVRYSIDNINRDRLLLPTEDLPQKNIPNGYYIPGINAGLHPWVFQSPHLSWVVDMDTNIPGCNPTLYLAGLPMNSGQTGPGPGDMPAPRVLDILPFYLDFLTNGDWGAAFRAWPGNPQTFINSDAFSTVLWTAAGAGLPNNFKFTVPGGWVHNSEPVAGDFIRIAGWKYTSPLKRQRYNGTWKVLNADATSVTVDASRVTVAPTTGIPGYIQVSVDSTTPYTGYSIANITHRKRGRPTFSLRGRR